MSNKCILDRIKEKYLNHENIIQYLKSIDERKSNSFEDIMISYDFQAGTYTDNYYAHFRGEKYREYYSAIANVLSNYVSKVDNAVLLEAGVGEATTLHSLLNLMPESDISSVYGLDASFSRLLYAKKFLEDNHQERPVKLIMGDMLNMPFLSDSVDIVYTVHACEPNGGREEEIVRELMRVTKRYLVLFEPAYDLADSVARERMIRLGYVTKLYETIVNMGLNVKEHHLLGVNLNESNPTGVTVIEKVQRDIRTSQFDLLACPVTKEKVEVKDNVCWCEKSLLLYPIINDIYCMTEDNAIVATKYNHFI